MTAREAVLKYLRSQIHGPTGGDVEVLNDPPYVRYLLGTLYPVNAAPHDVRDDEEEDGPSASTVEEGAVEDPIQLAHDWMPSSVGITFYFEGDPAIGCDVWAARYETFKEGRSRRWLRKPIADNSAPERVELRSPGEEGSRTRQTVLQGLGILDAFWRKVGNGWLVTVTLQNTQVKDKDAKLDPDLCLHQVGFRCKTSNGLIREYPSVTLLSGDAEEQELRLLYRAARVYAVGHGCAAVWKVGERNGEIENVATEFMPSHEVPPLRSDVGEHGSVLLLRRLADETLPIDKLTAELEAFVGTYEAWIEGVSAEYRNVPAGLIGARDRVVNRLRLATATMRRGIAILASDPLVLHAFRLANRAMLMQMRHSKDDLGGGRRRRGEPSGRDPDYGSVDYRWRPFQLAFQLLTLPSVASHDDQDRDVVDLIWFPTGGGKTEAYLSIAALEVFLRRLRWRDEGAGTVVLTRYTLRLLTAQQFQRAATLMCACELLRRQSPETLGASPIGLGLWVGQAVAPNTFQEAVEKLEETLEEPEPRNRFQLEQCPWCGTELVPLRHEEDRAAYGVEATAGTFRMFCPTERCAFHDRLPVSVVDEDLYTNPPTMLIATVDKFARLAWEERAGAFFGGANGRRPPSLIIQDELHLLTGPLGTTVGVYEAAVDGLIRMRGGRPKIVASTATIRRADDQVLNLFNREVRLFPAAGLKAGDSFFAREDYKAPGRLYVGVMSPSHTMAKTMVDVGAALLQAPVELDLQGVDRDAYWTLVAYHNSLRELGRTVTQANDDIRARLITIASDQSRVRRLGDDDIVELTSNVGGGQLPALLARLSKTCTEPDVISFLATTSMLSVGVDVPRLGLMVVNGQPKTTAEYIQATSRVGRTAQAPGLVVTLFSATKARDRSHYEGFVGYHQALYRSVEPASVTPYSLPSRARALHAALVILVRHGTALNSNDSAGKISEALAIVTELTTLLQDRVKGIDEREAGPVKLELQRLLKEWQARAEEAKGLGRALYYITRSKQHSSLLKDFGTAGPGWATLHSMRNVDRECPITVYGESS